MFEALVSGKLTKDPVVRTGPSGKAFTTCTVRVPTEREEAALANCIAFGEVGERLARLRAGDAVALVGTAKPNAWLRDGEPVGGVGITVQAVLTAYDVKRRRPAEHGHQGDGRQARGDSDPGPWGWPGYREGGA